MIKRLGNGFESDEIKKWYTILNGNTLVKNEKKVNLNQMYRYLNDEVDHHEFQFLFETTIINYIENIVRDFYLNNADIQISETNIHTEISNKLPKILLDRHSIIYQQESNPYVGFHSKKRIDFILSLPHKYIFCELKTIKSISIKKLKEQLHSYSNGIIVNAARYLLIFIDDHADKDKFPDIQKVASSFNFKIHYILTTSIKSK